jgi:hypothetical protein
MECLCLLTANEFFFLMFAKECNGNVHKIRELLVTLTSHVVVVSCSNCIRVVHG